ncbi:CRTAC1 family protein [Aureibaculum sp. A20]|uniref:CRTAC1 family protein n=1 Tax=Aureibaculum flavum TaxID=2795986 RepID=A0ABS0WNS0_9FLAO|nr:VCBS repeat-containing protein [Aureibaculum flavum]MBJ2173586.1 CRTAC1 family protein [Aureibaculum flavum]
MYLISNITISKKSSVCSVLMLLLIQVCLTAQTNVLKNTFTEVFKEFPRQEKDLRKWDSPVIADLDQDGHLDLLINDHGYAVQVQWNNNGKFTKPYDIIMGDLHGISVGDFDKDGNLEIIMSRGGGSGSNARNSKIFRVTKDRNFIELGDFKEPLAMMRGRTVAFIDGDNDGDLDLLNFAFPDATKKVESENYIYENNGKGQLILHSTLPAIKMNGQKTLVTDFNGDNNFDIILYGNGPLKAYSGNGDLSFEDVSNKLFPEKIEDVTAIAEIDFDNDGDFDLFITRGNEFAIGETFFDKESKTLGFFTKRGAFQLEDLEVGDVLNLENFQSQWPNNDTYFIGEASYDYEFEGETHSGKNIRLVNSDALGFPDNADYSEKKGWYIGYVGNRKWRIAGFLWAPATGVVHGVENYPEGKHPEGFNDILLENTGKRFKNVTKEFGLSNKEHTMAVSVADFDNNGFQDLLVVKRGDLIHANASIIYLNSKDSGFKKLEKHNVISPELGAIGMAVETFDYNQDGKVDVVLGNERGKWHLFKNELSAAKDNNYITVEVGNSKTEKASALGALVEIESCGNHQIQRVGSTGASYSLSHNNFVNFGLSKCKTIKVKVTWTNGETENKTISTVNKKIKIGI